jgi:hypothetical protein
MIERRSFVILAGIALLVAGCFLPMFRVKGDSAWEDPKDSTYWDTVPDNDIPADGPAMYILPLALVAGLMILTHQTDSVWLPGLLISITIFTHLNGFWVFTHDNHSLGLGQCWLLLIPGAILILCAPAIPMKTVFYPEVVLDSSLLEEQP